MPVPGRKCVSTVIQRACRLYARGYLSTRHFRPREGERVNYDLLFMGRRMAGERHVAELSLEADSCLDLIDAALLTGTAPGVDSIFWRPLPP